ncbi:hypothetical protein NX722_07580 [Endozoicomonas gorgoniicola]|uniref:Uncharacterized protein n=1 Tax=Endozoicomonas gorgoniicola TaxID=1234144 RepID=A0ABT3MTV3_9GAMM|nr:hypothetical protein [Endozoicomonas gorgoniicola]MCW7552508.1 hypothetical protein [Endozoicomonas gorgoniicola]
MGYRYYCPGLLVLLYCSLTIHQAVADDIAPFTSDGWPYPRDYRALTEEELEQVNRQTEGRYPNRSGQQVE